MGAVVEVEVVQLGCFGEKEGERVVGKTGAVAKGDVAKGASARRAGNSEDGTVGKLFRRINDQSDEIGTALGEMLEKIVIYNVIELSEVEALDVGAVTVGKAGSNGVKRGNWQGDIEWVRGFGGGRGRGEERGGGFDDLADLGPRGVVAAPRRSPKERGSENVPTI